MKQKRGLLKSSVVSLVLLMVMMFAMTITASAEAPSGLRQTDDSDTSVKVEWTGVAGARYYGVEAATDIGFTNVVYRDYCSYSTQYDYCRNLAAGQTYYVRVGYGDKSSTCYANFSAPIEVVTRPAKVDGLKFVGATDTTATIAWNPVLGANLYLIQYNNQVFQTADSAIALPYVAGVSYAKINAARVSATGYVAAETSYTTVNNISALTNKISKDNFGFRNAWTSINDYQIAAIYSGHGMQASVYDAKSGKKKFSGETDNGTYSNVEFIKKFKYNTMYKYRVRAYITTTDGQRIYGGWSSYRYFVTPKKSTYTTSGRKIKLTWSKLTGVSKIKIEVSTKENSGYKTCATIGGTKTSYTITKYGKKALKKGKKYYFRITYYAKSGKKSYTSDIYTSGSATVR